MFQMKWTGIAALTAERIREPLRIAGDDIAAVAKVFQAHPSFHPRSYVDFRVEVTGPRNARIAISPRLATSTLEITRDSLQKCRPIVPEPHHDQ